MIDPAFCQDALLSVNFKYEVEPNVLCVAFNHTYKTKWFVKEKHNYSELEDHRNLNRLLGRTHDWYIVGTGTIYVVVVHPISIFDFCSSIRLHLI